MGGLHGRRSRIRLTAIFEKERDVYTATVPALDYSSTYGETLGEARAMIKNLTQLYLESLPADGLELPELNAAEEIFVGHISVTSV